MEQERRFTLAEAQELLDTELRALAERMVEARARSRDLESRWRRLVIAIGSNGGNMERPEVRELRETVEASHAELNEIVARFTAQGVQVKDMDRGPDRLPGRGGRPGGTSVLARGRAADRPLAFARRRLRRAPAAGMSAGTHLEAALAAEADAYRALLARTDAGPALLRARDAYLASHAETGPSSWGRLLGALKMAILAGDGAEAIARRAQTEVGPGDTPASAYLRALAQVTLDERPDVEVMLAAGDAFARTGRALQALGDRDQPAYAAALGQIVADFAAREQHLSGVSIADTALVLERLAAGRGMAVEPAGGGILRPDLGL